MLKCDIRCGHILASVRIMAAVVVAEDDGEKPCCLSTAMAKVSVMAPGA